MIFKMNILKVSYSKTNAKDVFYYNVVTVERLFT